MIDLKEIVNNYTKIGSNLTMEELIEKRNVIGQKLSETFEIEFELRNKLRLQYDTLQDEISNFGIPYKRLDLSFLSMVKKGKFRLICKDDLGNIDLFCQYSYPAFGVFSLEHPKFEIVTSFGRIVTTTPDVKLNFVMSYYNLKDIAKKMYNKRFTWTFSGCIPNEARKKIKEAKTYFFADEIYIIKELNEKDMRVTTVVDPLIIGVKNKMAYLIDIFDLTPTEEYISKEFTF